MPRGLRYAVARIGNGLLVLLQLIAFIALALGMVFGPAALIITLFRGPVWGHWLSGTLIISLLAWLFGKEHENTDPGRGY